MSRLADAALVASLFAATGRPYTSVTSHPGMMHHRAGSPLWRMKRGPSRIRGYPRRSDATTGLDRTLSSRRMTASFLYVGPKRLEEARAFGLLRNTESL